MGNFMESGTLGRQTEEEYNIKTNLIKTGCDVDCTGSDTSLRETVWFKSFRL
jgi:hypothetical protein